MRRRPPRSTRTDTLFPDTTRVRSLTITDSAGASATDTVKLVLFSAEPRTLLDETRTDPTPGVLGIGVPGTESFPFDVPEIGRAHVELQSLMRISYAGFCLKKKTINTYKSPPTHSQYKRHIKN